MPAVPYPKSSTPGRLPGEGEGRLINAVVVQEGDSFYTRRVPGLTDTGIDTGKTGPRGSLNVAGTVYAAYSGSAVTIAAGGAVMALTGALTGSDGVTIERNNRTTGGTSTPDVIAVREGGGAFVLTSSAVSAYPDADLPATVNSVSFMGGFGLFTCPDARIFASELNSTDINPLSFATAESRADALLRGIVRSNLFYAMGTTTIEPWSNEGLSPFPLQRSASVIPVGLLTTMAVAGYEEGWNQAAGFVASDGTVRLLQGFDTQVISTPSVERFIADSTTSTMECYVYTAAGRSIFGISSDAGTWEYDLTQPGWRERLSTGTTRWRGSRSVKRGEDWVVGDTLSGKLLKIDADAKAEAGAVLRWRIESAPVKGFPVRVQVPAYFGNFAKAAGSVFTQWSHDGGDTWSLPIERDLSQADRFPVRINRLGLSTQHGVRIRHYVDDPVDVSFMGGSIPKPGQRAP